MKKNLIFIIVLSLSLVLTAACGVSGVGTIVPLDEATDPSSLVGPTDEIIPDPEDIDDLQAVFESSDGRALISVFKGTDLPAGDLTIEVIDPANVEESLKGTNPHFAVRMGPDGTVFNQPVRISFLAGSVLLTDDGALIIPVFEAFTHESGDAVLLDEIEVEITEDGLIIVHALASHFSDGAYRAGAGVEISIDNPTDGQEFYMYEDTITTQMTATNKGKKNIRLIPTETVADTVIISPFNFDPAIELLGPNQSGQFGVGSGVCQTTGRTSIEFDVKGDRNIESTDSIELKDSLILFKIHRSVICHALDTWMTVTFNPETHTTHYSAQVFRNDGFTGSRTDITFDGSVEYKWASANTCGSFDNPGDDPRNYWNHEDCDEADEANSSVSLTVTYTDPNGRKIKRVYKASPARADEGFLVVF